MVEKEINPGSESFSPLSTAEIAELDFRLTEDNSIPNDTVAWETIKSEAQTRWQR